MLINGKNVADIWSDMPMYMSSAAVNGVNVPVISYNPPNISVNNIDSRASIAEAMRAGTDDNLNKFTSKTESNGITVYYFDKSITRIDVPGGFGTFSCSRSYYYNYGMLYAADIYSGSLHTKLYFSDGSLYRMLNYDGSIADMKYDDVNYQTIASFALYEGNSIIEYKH